jgi:dihydrofolate synthase/folylpolyglutamate synthase
MAKATYAETLRYLWGLKRLGARPGTQVIRELLRALGDPQRSFVSVHITGSKGKGSVAKMVSSILTSAGHRTGLYTSPHLLSYRERIVVNERPITPLEVATAVQRVRDVAADLRRVERIDRDPTFFEVTTAAAFEHFRSRGVEYAAVEVGIGGRLDATNTLEAPVCVLTTLELEHTDLLGPTIVDIAREKAGILHPGSSAVVGIAPGPGLEEVRRQANQRGVPLWRLGEEVSLEGRRATTSGQYFRVRTPARYHPDLRLSLLGEFQSRNAALAVAALDLLSRVTGQEIPEAALRRGLKRAQWPGRLERLSRTPPIYLDAAHTPESARELLRSLRELEPRRSREDNVLLFSCLADKRAEEIFDELSGFASSIVLAPLRNARAMDPELLRRAARGRFPRIYVAPSVRDGLSWARAGLGRRGCLLATGGVYLAGEVLSAFRSRPAEEPDLADPLPVPAALARRAPRERPVSRGSQAPTRERSPAVEGGQRGRPA